MAHLNVFFHGQSTVAMVQLPQSFMQLVVSANLKIPKLTSGVHFGFDWG